MTNIKELIEGNIEAIESNIKMIQAVLTNLPNSDTANFQIKRLSNIPKQLRNEVLVIETLTLEE